MKPILVIYATREGQTRHIAEHICEYLSARLLDGTGAPPDAFEPVDAASIPEGFSLAKYSAAILSASLHMGRYEPEMAAFVKRHLAELRKTATMFISVSLAERTAEDEHIPPDKRAEAQGHVNRVIEAFLKETGWRPSHIASVAGALKYSKYGLVTRFMMKRISKSAGGPVDTSRDYEFTDWPKLDRMVEDFSRTALAAGAAT